MPSQTHWVLSAAKAGDFNNGMPMLQLEIKTEVPALGGLAPPLGFRTVSTFGIGNEFNAMVG